MIELERLMDVGRFVMFWGGADIDPVLYGEKNTHSSTSQYQDTEDCENYTLALDGNIPCFGICRGHQFLWALSGGKLCQHIFPYHEFEHTVNGLPFRVNSLHHQGPIPESRPEGLSILGSHKGTVEAFMGKNAHGIWCVGVQWHPELLPEHHPARVWFVERCAEVLRKVYRAA
jgi:putative glutamine amidotransferase